MLVLWLAGAADTAGLASGTGGSRGGRWLWRMQGRSCGLEIKPRHLEVGLRTTCTSQRKGAAPEAERGTFVHRYGGGRSSHPSKSTRHAATASPQDDEPETTGGPRRQTCFF
ncbi:uncharacterized protein ACIBXB_009560 isoform 1-T1 [Morphnus guianensis]